MPSFTEQTYHHNEFQQRGVAQLKQAGFQVEDGTYHNKFSEQTKSILKNLNYDFTGLYIKGWADNYIFKDGFAALIEWKAAEYKRQLIYGQAFPNASIEATSYAFHYYLAQVGVKIIYAYNDSFYGVEKGFLVNGNGNPFDIVNKKVRFPVKADNNLETKQKQIAFLKFVFDGSIEFNDKPSGNNVSPDPYFLIKSDVLEQLNNWMDILP